MKHGRKIDWLSWRRVDRVLLRRILTLGLFGFLVGFAAIALWMWAGAPSRDVVTVPDLRAQRVAAARSLLSRTDLEMEIGDSLPNPRIAAGAVLAQSPLPGREVAPGTTVRVILSTGRQRIRIPPVSALSREQAIRVLQASGFRVAVLDTPNARAAGRVIGTQPAAGAAVPIPAPVRLLVSAGPPRVAVPSVVGLLEEEVAAALSAAGLRLGQVEREFQTLAREGEILAQSPAAGDSIPTGSRVNIVVATQLLLGEPTEVR